MLRHHLECLIRIDLTNRTVKREEINSYDKFMSGMGVGEEILFNEVKPWMSPFDPGNKIIFSSGPASGTITPGSGRTAAVTKSPLTLGIASSNAGGSFSAQMKYAGIDHIVIEGRASEPSYVLIDDGAIELLNASDMIGKGVWEADDYLRAKHGNDIGSAIIGPAGENLVRFASVMIDKHRAMGRCGIGAVMGSKNLKAIAVKGTGSVRLHDEKKFFDIMDDYYDRVDRLPAFQGLMKFGTMACKPSKVRIGGYVYRHFQDIKLPEATDRNFDPQLIMEKYRKFQTSCYGCFAGCQPSFELTEGPYKGLIMEGTQFNSSFDFGSKLDIDDFAFCIKATAMCNDFGMDIDCTAEIAGWLMECYEKGLITGSDMDGMEIRFGDQENTLAIIEKMASREGVGNLLAEGIARAATFFPEPTRYYAAHLKGNALYETMSSVIAYGLGAATSTRGGTHVLGAPVCEGTISNHELAKRKFFGITTYNEPLSFEGKPEMVLHTEIITRLCSCMGICLFASDWQDMDLFSVQDMADLLYAITGVRMTEKDLADRMLGLLCLEKLFNYTHAGYTREDDYPPRRLMVEKVPSGPAKGSVLDKERWDKLLDHYYDIHGWDRLTGLPTKETLEKLGVGFLVGSLENGAKIPGHSFI